MKLVGKYEKKNIEYKHVFLCGWKDAEKKFQNEIIFRWNIYYIWIMSTAHRHAKLKSKISEAKPTRSLSLSLSLLSSILSDAWE